MIKKKCKFSDKYKTCSASNNVHPLSCDGKNGKNSCPFWIMIGELQEHRKAMETKQ